MKQILILEDEFSLGYPWREALEEAGYQVIHVATATEAIAVLKEGKVDLIISDILIRSDCGEVQQQGGLSVMAHINLWMDKRPRVIAVSGAHTSLQILSHAQNMRADITLRKPVKAIEVLHSVQELLGDAVDGDSKARPSDD